MSRSPLDEEEASAPTLAPGSGAGSVPRVLGTERKPEIPGYVLHELVGRGGMGEVWRATQSSLGRTVAVKLLREELSRDASFAARFEQEAAALAALAHPNVVQAIDRGNASGTLYFVMEFVPGRSLRDELDRGRLPPARALRVITDVCRALEAAHGRGVVHRDIKPENVLVDDAGHVKVADFGLAGFLGGSRGPQLTGTAVGMGTAHYMAPEQRRDARAVDGRADLYALGVMAYELLVGELPVGRFPLPSAVVPGVDSRVDALVERCLAPDPAGRPASAAEVRGALEALAATAVPAAAAAGSAPVGRRRPLALAWGAASVLLVVGAGLALWAVRGGTGTPPEAPAPRDAPAAAAPFPANTPGELHVRAEESREGGRERLAVSFEPGEEQLNVHAGTWTLEEGRLHALQAGNETDEPTIIPRTYLAHRYFAREDAAVEVEVALQDVSRRYGLGPGVQQFAEVSYRVRDVQVSAMGPRGGTWRLVWRYVSDTGREVDGTSAGDLAFDESPVEEGGVPAKVKLSLRREDGGTVAEGFVNGRRFAEAHLPGFTGKPGKVALGCRNLECWFRGLGVEGRPGTQERR